jgi:succinyl-CoA synthetase beta subunit
MTDVTTIRLRIPSDQTAEVDDLARDLSSLLGVENVKATEVASFTGVSEVLLILSGVAVALKQVAPIIVAWLKRNESKKFKSKQIEVSGYSASELLKILEQAERE